MNVKEVIAECHFNMMIVHYVLVC